MYVCTPLRQVLVCTASLALTAQFATVVGSVPAPLSDVGETPNISKQSQPEKSSSQHLSSLHEQPYSPEEANASTSNEHPDRYAYVHIYHPNICMHVPPPSCTPVALIYIVHSFRLVSPSQPHHTHSGVTVLAAPLLSLSHCASSSSASNTSTSDSRAAAALRHVLTEAGLLTATCAVLWGALRSSNPRY